MSALIWKQTHLFALLIFLGNVALKLTFLIFIVVNSLLLKSCLEITELREVSEVVWDVCSCSTAIIIIFNFLVRPVDCWETCRVPLNFWYRIRVGRAGWFWLKQIFIAVLVPEVIAFTLVRAISTDKIPAVYLGSHMAGGKRKSYLKLH